MSFLSGAIMMAAMFFPPAAAPAGWGAPRVISDSTLPSRIKYNFGRPIAVDGAGVVHAAWLEATSEDPPGHGSGRVMYSRSPDDGRTWTPPIALGPPVPATGHPRVAASGPHVYVAWHAANENTLKVHLVHSPAHGSSWEPPQILSHHPAGAHYPVLAACGESVHLAWADSRSGVNEIYLRSSADAAREWNLERQVSSPDGRSSWTPAIACWGPHIHVAWSDDRHNVGSDGAPHDCGRAQDASTCREEEYYRRSTDFGATWEPEVRLTHDAARPHPSWAPSIAAWENSVHVVFFDRRTDRFRIYYKRSTGAGAAGTWEGERVISPEGLAPTDHARPVVDALGPLVHVVWFSATPFVGVNVWHTASADNGDTFDPPGRLNPRTAGHEMHPSIAISPGRSAHVVWQQPEAHGVDRIVHRAWRPRRASPASPWN